MYKRNSPDQHYNIGLMKLRLKMVENNANDGMTRLLFLILFSIRTSMGTLLALFGCIIALFQWLFSEYVINMVVFFFFFFVSISAIIILLNALYSSVITSSVIPKVLSIKAHYDQDNKLMIRFVLAPSERFRDRLAVSVYYKEDGEIPIGSGYVETVTEGKLVQVIITAINERLSGDEYIRIITPDNYCFDRYIVKPFLLVN
jgi:hypothetical protein